MAVWNVSCFRMLSVALLLCLLGLGCAIPDREDGFSVASYNVQTLFDDQLDGFEFSEFIPSDEGWNSKKYHNRLRQLSRVIRDLTEGAADILVLQEVENAQVIEDLDRYFIRDLNYRHVAVSGRQGLSIAVLSRLPFIATYVHAVQWGSTTLRPQLEVHVSISDSVRLILYAVHWKSKRGSDPHKNEELRQASAHVLSQAIIKNREEFPQAFIVVAGDFNEDINEFAVQNGEYQTALMPISEIATWQAGGEKLMPLFVASSQQVELDNEDGIPVLHHLWQDDGGSYYFDHRWEKIDQILFSAEFFASYNQITFRTADAHYLLNSSAQPRKYQSRSASGYSDHLPIILEFSLR